MKKKVVADVMTRDVKTVERNDRLAVAEDVMRLGKFRHLVVVDDEGGLAGIVSSRDLFHNALLKALGFGTRAKEQALQGTLVKEAMTTDVLTTTPDTPLSEAAKVMRDRKVGCLVVLHSGKIAGILTEGDFVALAASDAGK
jgi:CBS domain-containing protein